MDANTTTKRTAADAHATRISEARELIARLSRQLDAADQIAAPNWADVGDLAHMVSELRGLANPDAF